jgi:hypothetical protein
LSEELEIVNHTLDDKSSENSTLKVKIEDLEVSLKQQEEDYSTNQSRQSSRYE